MGFVFRLALAAALLGVPTAAAAQVKFKRCLSSTEIQVEQLVRHGVFLREAGNRCDEMVPGTARKWRAFDERFGPRLKQQTDRRAKLFQREFKQDALKVRTYFDGRLVTYHRNVPLTVAYCTQADEMLDDITKRGWGGFTEQAKVVQNEVLLDYKACQ
ncbi:MAG TPA: hypothetical protein VK196_02770 [Magnetospirillum sp.]|nr:hypothetical protein [Magnetospirillum sp.]